MSNYRKLNRVFTGNYEECKVGNLISISGDRGKEAGFIGKAIPQLAPKKEFWETWHNNIGKIPEEENTKYYIREYYWQVLSKVDIVDLLSGEMDPILLCYEKNQDFCHRHVLAEYISLKYDKDVNDIKIDEDLNVEINPKPRNIRRLLDEVLREDFDKLQDEDLKKKLKVLRPIKSDDDFIR